MKKILNIFSREKSSPESKIKIIIDHREKNSLIPSLLVEQGFQTEWQQLPVADYLVHDTAVERKTVSDLKASIINKRLVQQLLELKQYPSHLLLVEGILDEDLYSSGIHENALRGFLLTVALEFKTPIIFTHNEKDTAKYLAVLAKKQTRPEASIRASKISLTKKEQQQFILEGFPHVGPAKAKQLLEKFRTLNNVFNAPEKSLEESLGKRAKDFKELLN